MEQWIFTKDEVLNSPSITHDGLSAAEEQQTRSKGCLFIQAIGCQLGLPQNTVATAMVYFHRFYMRYCFSDFSSDYLAATCIYLACKVEESSRKVNDVATACMMNRCVQDARNEEKQKVHQAFRTATLWHERLLLETLCFDLTVDHPHQLVLEFANELEAPDNVTQAAFGFANDSLRRPLCLIYDPQMIAAACVLLGYRLSSVRLPLGADTIWGKTLQQQSDLLADIVGDMMTVYSDTSIELSPNSNSPKTRLTPSSYSSPSHRRTNGHHKSSSLRNGYTDNARRPQTTTSES
ncbi:cyclin-like protein [Hesseltinella vesiculosa]|uniref:Cyclin-like protein n=1 Tax=Hesseltinella vesiculosa TaxID=101127 RepID=A0A1X2G3P5_9FUNG|nr:cyclin-like protein [Hesseltinella vesiculosa]